MHVDCVILEVSVVRFGKHPDLVVHTDEPFNAGPPLHRLIEAPVTPNDLFYVRNHGNVPAIAAERYRLSITGLVREPVSLSLDDLRQFPEHTLVATLQCAGNRRHELMAYAPIPDELPWGDDAISTAVWTGVRLRDVLLAAGIQLEDGAHVAFSALDTVERQGQQFGFGSSIPTARALQPDVLLAYAMNGAPLPAPHGFPLRAVVPGYIGARSVKWLQSIRIQATPSDNYFQAHAYKLFPGWVTPETANFDEGLMLGEAPINATICAPEPGRTLPAGPVRLRGFAIAGLRAVERVDVSTDDGQTWCAAELLPPLDTPDLPTAWRLWQADVTLDPGQHTLVVRAWDSAANTQPADVGAVWNFKGYANNAWHRVPVDVIPPVT